MSDAEGTPVDRAVNRAVEEPAAEPRAGLPLAQAVERLGTTKPRLRRTLARAEFAGDSWEAEYRTEKGMRRTLFVSETALERLRNALEPEREPEQTESNTFQERSGSVFTFSGPVPESVPESVSEQQTSSVPVPGADQAADHVADQAADHALIAQYEARIADLQTALERERAVTDDALRSSSELRRLLSQQQQLTAVKLIPAAESPAPDEKKTVVATLYRSLRPG